MINDHTVESFAKSCAREIALKKDYEEADMVKEIKRAIYKAFEFDRKAEAAKTKAAKASAPAQAEGHGEDEGAGNEEGSGNGEE